MDQDKPVGQLNYNIPWSVENPGYPTFCFVLIWVLEFPYTSFHIFKE